MTATDDALPLGRAPRPATGEDLAARVRDLLARMLRTEAVELGRARVHAALAGGADVAALEIDVTGVHLRGANLAALDRTTAAAAPADGPDGPDGPDDAAGTDAWTNVVAREDAHLRRLRVEAHPVQVAGVPVDVLGELTGLRFRWLTTADGNLGVQPFEPAPGDGATGTVRLAAPRDVIVGAVCGLLVEQAAEAGVHATGVRCDVTSDGPRTVRFRGSARLRWKALGARLRAEATATVDDEMVMRFRDVRVRSTNPAVKLLLRLARKHIDAAHDERVDLRSELSGGGLRLADVRIETGRTLAVTATFT